MFSARIPLFSLLGFRISIDISWFLLAIYLILSLSTRYFPGALPRFDATTYFMLGVLGAFGFFASIVLHELAHAVVARGFGTPVGGITLFIFGGVAELRQEPKTPRAEFWIAIAGPIASMTIALACFALHTLAIPVGFRLLAALFGFLALANTVLALFNLVPAFPLDGGRILRSLLWWRMGNLKRATRIAATAGSIFGVGLMILGGLQILTGSAVSGTWQLLIGLFLTMAASQTRNQTEVLEDLRDVVAADVMDHNPLIVSPDITVDALVNDYIYKHSRKFIIVVENEHALGYIGPQEVKAVRQTEWRSTPARAIVRGFTHDVTVTTQTPALDVLRKLQSNGVGYVVVFENNQCVGAISESDLTNYLAVRQEIAGVS